MKHNFRITLVAGYILMYFSLSFIAGMFPWIIKKYNFNIFVMNINLSYLHYLIETMKRFYLTDTTVETNNH